MASKSPKHLAESVFLGMALASGASLGFTTSASSLISSHSLVTYAVTEFSSLDQAKSFTNYVTFGGETPLPPMLVSSNIKPEKDVWEEIDALYGVLEHVSDSELDEWLNSLRDRSGDRLKEIYGDDWE